MMIGLPVSSKEMVIKYIYNHRCIFPENGPQPFLAFFNNRMGISESINHAVQAYSSKDIALIQALPAAFDMVGDEITYGQSGMVGRKVQVSEIIHLTEGGCAPDGSNDPALTEDPRK